MLNTKLYIRNKGPLKGYYIKVYKLRDLLPTGYKEGTKNIGATIIINKKLTPRKKSAAKVVEDRRLLIQVKINYMHYKMGR